MNISKQWQGMRTRIEAPAQPLKAQQHTEATEVLDCAKEEEITVGVSTQSAKSHSQPRVEGGKYRQDRNSSHLQKQDCTSAESQSKSKSGVKKNKNKNITRANAICAFVWKSKYKHKCKQNELYRKRRPGPCPLRSSAAICAFHTIYLICVYSI